MCTKNTYNRRGRSVSASSFNFGGGIVFFYFISNKILLIPKKKKKMSPKEYWVYTDGINSSSYRYQSTHKLKIEKYNP